MAITAFLSRSPGLLNRGLRAQPLWVLVLSTVSYLQLTDFLSSPRLYNCSTSTFFLWVSQIALIQPVHGQGYILIFLDRMHLLFTQVHFLFWQLGRGQYVTESPLATDDNKKRIRTPTMWTLSLSLSLSLVTDKPSLRPYELFYQPTHHSSFALRWHIMTHSTLWTYSCASVGSKYILLMFPTLLYSCHRMFTRTKSSGLWYWRLVFVFKSYLSSIVHSHNYLSVRNTNRTLVTEKMHCGLIFSRVKQFTMNYQQHIYCPCKLYRMNTEMSWNTIKHIIEKSPIVWLKSL